MFALAGNKWNTTLPGGNMQFQGVIIAETCRIEAGDKQMTVNMGQISSNRFHAVGEDSAPVPFVIHLRECSTVVSERVGVAFHGVADGKNPDVLSVGEGPGIATNIGLMMKETSYRLIVLQQTGNGFTQALLRYISSPNIVLPGVGLLAASPMHRPGSL